MPESGLTMDLVENASLFTHSLPLPSGVSTTFVVVYHMAYLARCTQRKPPSDFIPGYLFQALRFVNSRLQIASPKSSLCLFSIFSWVCWLAPNDVVSLVVAINADVVLIPSFSLRKSTKCLGE